jgi:heat shock protein HtpX
MNPSQLRSHRLENHLQAFVLILGMALIMSLVGYALGGRTGVWLSIGVSIASLLIGTSASPRAMLQMFRARPIEPQKLPELYDLFGDLVRLAKMPYQPKLYYVPTPLLNAFAVGADRDASIAVTDGLLRTMTKRELAGILAHELSHLRFGDTQLMALSQVFSRMTSVMTHITMFLLFLSLPAAMLGAPFISFGGLLVLVSAPFASMLLQMALSRSREFNADLGAIEITGDPQGLANALEKLERTQWCWLERLFAPYRALEPNVLRTHPATEQRIHRLRQLAGDFSATHNEDKPLGTQCSRATFWSLVYYLLGTPPGSRSPTSSLMSWRKAVSMF